MIPLTFCLENAIEIIPDWRRRILEGEARKWANAKYRKRAIWPKVDTLQEYMVIAHEQLVWGTAYDKRKARIERMASEGVPR